MMADGVAIDGSWKITIKLPELDIERTLRVFGDEHIGAIMLRLVEELDISQDWSDYALWMPQKNIWLTKTRQTLNAYGVLSDSKLTFTPMHKTVLVQMPDLQQFELFLDFSCDVFSCVMHICKELGLRHPEELSLMKHLSKEQLKEQIKQKNRSNDTTGRQTLEFLDTSYGADTSLNTSTLSNTRNISPQGTLLRSPFSPLSPTPNSVYNGTLSPGSLHSLSFDSIDSSLANSPHVPTKEGLQRVHRPKNFIDKAHLNFAWLDSSRTLMDQGVNGGDLINLRYKYFSIYDLNPKYDLIRINQIYEQAKWSVLAEEMDCTEPEMLMFAALQLQVSRQLGLPQMDRNSEVKGQDEVDMALTELQECLEGQTIIKHSDIMSVPELSTYIRYLKPKKFMPKTYRSYWATLKDTTIFLYKNRDDPANDYVTQVKINGCEATPDVNIRTSRFMIKLHVSTNDENMEDVHLKFEAEQPYIEWMAACKMASKGRTMADSSYEAEVQAITEFLQLQRPTGSTSHTLSDGDIQPEEFIAPRFLKKVKVKQYIQKILEAHANVESMNLVESKLAFIKAWQALPEFGISYFVIRFKNSKKEELLGIASDRIMRMDVNTGEAHKTWRYNTLRSWNVNWEVRHVNLDFEDGDVAFACLTSDCKVVHEYIGGYIFLSMRSQDKNQALDREMFFKLTGGWI